MAGWADALFKVPPPKNRSRRQKDRIIEALRKRPSTARQLSEVLDVSFVSIDHYVRKMHADAEVYISAWIPGPKRPVRVFSAGDYADWKYVKQKRKLKGSDRTKSRRDVLAALSTPRTAREIAKLLGRKDRMIREILRTWKHKRKIYVTEWRRLNNTGGYAPVYARGGKPDAIRLKRKSFV